MTKGERHMNSQSSMEGWGVWRSVTSRIPRVYTYSSTIAVLSGSVQVRLWDETKHDCSTVRPCAAPSSLHFPKHNCVDTKLRIQFQWDLDTSCSRLPWCEYMRWARKSGETLGSPVQPVFKLHLKLTVPLSPLYLQGTKPSSHKSVRTWAGWKAEGFSWFSVTKPTLHTGFPCTRACGSIPPTELCTCCGYGAGKATPKPALEVLAPSECKGDTHLCIASK